MRAHLAVDVVENGVALSQRPQAIAKNVEPPHVAKPFLYFPGSGRGLPHLGDREHETIPTRFLRFEMLASSARQFVKLRLASGFVHVPTRRHPTLLFYAIERRIQRSLFDVEHLV